MSAPATSAVEAVSPAAPSVSHALLTRVRPHLRKPLHHEYTRKTPRIVLWTFASLIVVIALVLAIGLASGQLVVSSPGAVLLYGVLAAIAVSLPIRLANDSWITFTELFLVISFVTLPVTDSVVTIGLVAIWTVFYRPQSWFGGANHGGSLIIEAGCGLAAAIGVSHGLHALGAPAIAITCAQVIVATVAMNVGLLVSRIPYVLFVRQDLRSVLNPLTLRDVGEATWEALVALTPTTLLAAFAAERVAWLPALALVPLLQSWWAVERSVQLVDARRRAITDPLTGLRNRAGLQEALVGRFDATTRDVAFILGDIDGFKQVNDRLGHAKGDDVLRQVARIIERAAGGDRCVAARYGGEEFVAIHFASSPAEAIAWAEQLRRDVHAALEEVGSGISLGVTSWRGSVDSVGAAIERADVAMYAAKTAGRNQTFVMFDDDRLRPALDAVEAQGAA